MRALVYHANPGIPMKDLRSDWKPTDWSKVPLTWNPMLLFAGAIRIGWDVAWRNIGAWEGDTETAACVIVHGFRNRKRAVRDAYAQRGVPVIVVDAGYYRRDLDYRSLGLNGLNWMPPEDCPDLRAREIGLLAGNRAEGDYVLLCSQLAADAQHAITDINDWAHETAKALRKHTDRPIVWRVHPLHHGRINVPDVEDLSVHLPKGSRIAQACGDAFQQATLEEDLAGAHAAVMHNSTTAYSAFVAGVPVFCDPSAVYSDIATVNISRIECPRDVPVSRIQRFLNRVAYSQWTARELWGGEPLAFVSQFFGYKRDDAPRSSMVDELQHEKTKLEAALMALREDLHRSKMRAESIEDDLKALEVKTATERADLLRENQALNETLAAMRKAMDDLKAQAETPRQTRSSRRRGSRHDAHA